MQISIKKILTVLVIVILLSQLHKIAAVVNGVYQFFWNSFDPLRNSPPLARYTAVLMFLALVWITGYYLLLNRRK
jgi:hypothetical protein